MKKFVITAFIILCSVTVQAQTVSGISSTPLSRADKVTGVRIGIRAGLDFARLSSGTVGFDTHTAFHAGMTVSVPIVNFGSPAFKQGFGMIMGLFVYGKGAELKYKYGDRNVKESVSPLYLQLPMLVYYRCKPGKAVQLQIDLGPYFAYGIGGKYKIEYSEDNEKVSSETDFFGGDEIFKRADYGLHIGAGATIVGHYHVGIAYEIGLCDIIHKRFRASTESWRNCVLSLSFGYDF